MLLLWFVCFWTTLCHDVTVVCWLICSLPYFPRLLRCIFIQVKTRACVFINWHAVCQLKLSFFFSPIKDYQLIAHTHTHTHLFICMMKESNNLIDSAHIELYSSIQQGECSSAHTWLQQTYIRGWFTSGAENIEHTHTFMLLWFCAVLAKTDSLQAGEMSYGLIHVVPKKWVSSCWLRWLWIQLGTPKLYITLI